MVKITLGEQPAQSEKPFPKLMIAVTVNGVTIIFAGGIKDGYIVGQCLYSTNPSNKPGKIYDGWVSDIFTDYNEPITIQNA